MMLSTDTICAISTAPGIGGIAVIRVSGPEAVSICDCVFSGDLSSLTPMSVSYGNLKNGDQVLDEVLISKFVNPKSFTGEDTIEINCHGSLFIQQSILSLLIRKGCRMAENGEFTKRAFLNGKMDLSQAEAVADLIASETSSQHRLALTQMKGGFSSDISSLRQKLIDFASLIELELDFSEEDVEFADRSEFRRLVSSILLKVKNLIDSFQWGNVMKSGTPVAIVGPPNSGKSTLLNALLKEDRAIVSDIAGTTRDIIEDRIVVHGQLIRFIDTAGLRNTDDEIEKKGIGRALERARNAKVILFVYDVSSEDPSLIDSKLEAFSLQENGNLVLHVLANKCDVNHGNDIPIHHIQISAMEGDGIDDLLLSITDSILEGSPEEGDPIITNVRHHSLLVQVAASLELVLEGLDSNLTADLLSIEIRRALHALGELTGEISTEDLLGNIFSKFCIGK